MVIESGLPCARYCKGPSYLHCNNHDDGDDGSVDDDDDDDDDVMLIMKEEIFGGGEFYPCNSLLVPLLLGLPPPVNCSRFWVQV